MSAEVETMMYAGEIPWHQQGTPLIDIATAEEAITAAGLDWEVEIRKCFQEVDGTPIEIVGRKVLARATDNKVYGVYGNTYVPVQNKEAFTFFDSVTGTKAAKYDTAGSLREGAVIFILAKLDGSIKVKDEQIDKYLLLTNSHNGEFALKMFWTPIRVVCMNTLQMAMSRKATRFYSRHTTNIKTRVDSAREILGLADNYFKDFKAQADILAKKPISAAELDAMLKDAFQWEEVKIPAGAAPEYTPINRRELEMEKVMELVEVGVGQDNPKIKGTRWAAYNGVTEYVDHEREYRKDPLYGAWFGSGSDIKERSWNWLLKN